MAEHLQAEGYHITVVTPKIYKGSHSIEERDGITVYRFPFFANNKLLIEYEKIPYLKMICYYLSGFVVTLYALLRERCNLIHVHWAIPTGLIGVITGGLLRKPYVVTIHGSDFRMAMEGPSLLKKAFLQVCRKAMRVTCVSDGQKKVLNTLGIEENLISVFPMCVDDKFLRMTGKRRESG